MDNSSTGWCIIRISRDFHPCCSCGIQVLESVSGIRSGRGRRLLPHDAGLYYGGRVSGLLFPIPFLPSLALRIPRPPVKYRRRGGGGNDEGGGREETPGKGPGGPTVCAKVILSFFHRGPKRDARLRERERAKQQQQTAIKSSSSPTIFRSGPAERTSVVYVRTRVCARL